MHLAPEEDHVLLDSILQILTSGRGRGVLMSKKKAEEDFFDFAHLFQAGLLGCILGV